MSSTSGHSNYFPQEFNGGISLLDQGFSFSNQLNKPEHIDLIQKTQFSSFLSRPKQVIPTESIERLLNLSTISNQKMDNHGSFLPMGDGNNQFVSNPNFIENDYTQIPSTRKESSDGYSLSNNSKPSHSRTSSSTTDFTEVSKPLVATTYWVDEKTVCYQVRVRGVLVSRRQDTNFVNGTKLLNVIGMTRGKRDGILKTEKVRSVIKAGSMNLKGIWLPLERAYEIARNEGVEDLLYPLFVKDMQLYFESTGHRLKADHPFEVDDIILTPTTPGKKLLDTFPSDEQYIHSTAEVVNDLFHPIIRHDLRQDLRQDILDKSSDYSSSQNPSVRDVKHSS